MEDIKRFIQIYNHQDSSIKKDLFNIQAIAQDTSILEFLYSIIIC